MAEGGKDSACAPGASEVKTEAQKNASKPSHEISGSLLLAVYPQELILTFSCSRPESSLKSFLTIVNISPKIQYFKIAPLENTNFTLRYVDQESLAPGLNQRVRVTFTPKKGNDDRETCMKILCKNDSYLEVPIKVVEKQPQARIRKYIDFGLVPLYSTVKEIIKIPCFHGKRYKMSVIVKGHTDDIKVKPEHCIVRDKPIYMIVEYTPTHYVTLSCEIELHGPYFQSNPHVMTVTGYCKPPEQNPFTLGFEASKRKYLQRFHEELLRAINGRYPIPLERNNAHSSRRELMRDRFRRQFSSTDLGKPSSSKFVPHRRDRKDRDEGPSNGN